MNILVIDAQGGGIGRQLIMGIKSSIPNCKITAVGTNSAATSAMLKAGADNAATGENAVKVGARKADVIVGPIGIVIADALFGEITPDMAVAVGQSNAKRILIPINHCDNIIAGVPDLSMGRLVESAINEIRAISREDKIERAEAHLDIESTVQERSEMRYRDAEDVLWNLKR